MLGMTRQLRVWAYTSPVDMRKGFDSLFGLVRCELGRDPLEGDAFLFVSRSRRLAKVLLWDGTGLCIYAKRMERSRFAKLWGVVDGVELELTSAELAAYLDGWTQAGKARLSAGEFRVSGLTLQHLNASIQAC
jgi:transposase